MIKLINQSPLLIFPLIHLLMTSYELVILFFKKRRVGTGEYIDKAHVVILSFALCILLAGYDNIINFLF